MWLCFSLYQITVVFLIHWLTLRPLESDSQESLNPCGVACLGRFSKGKETRVTKIPSPSCLPADSACTCRVISVIHFSLTSQNNGSLAGNGCKTPVLTRSRSACVKCNLVLVTAPRHWQWSFLFFFLFPFLCPSCAAFRDTCFLTAPEV